MDVDELLGHAMRDGVAGFDTGNGRIYTLEEVRMIAIELEQNEVERSKPRIVIVGNPGDEALALMGLKLRHDFEVMIGVDCSEPVMICPVDMPKFARSKDYSESRKNKSDRKRDRANRWR
jgi:hypothetical protein